MVQSFIDYFRHSIGELKKVVWPTRRDVIRHTLIILLAVAIATLIIALVDFGLDLLVKQFLLSEMLGRQHG